MENPYAPPKAALESQASNLATPTVKLFSISGIGIATFFGSILAGAIIMAINFRRLNQAGQANMAVLLGFITTTAILVLSAFLPENFPGVVLTVVQLFAMIKIAQSNQGPAIADHLSAGGKLSSNWSAFGISLLVIIPIIVVIFMFIISQEAEF